MIPAVPRTGSRPLPALIFFSLMMSLGGLAPLTAQEDPWASADNPQPTKPPVLKGAAWSPPAGTQESGTVSYYADKYQGRLTASGETFDQKKLTAAHKRLAFGTRVRVTNQNNGKSVEVVINDRGPFITGRIIDLSRVAAEAIDLPGAGIAPATLIVLPATAEATPHATPSTDPDVDSTPAATDPTPSANTNPEPTQTWTASPSSPGNLIDAKPLPGSPLGSKAIQAGVFFQLGAYKSFPNARTLAKNLKAKGFDSRIRQEGEVFRVFVIGKAGLPALKQKAALETAGFTAPQQRTSPPPGQDVE